MSLLLVVAPILLHSIKSPVVTSALLIVSLVEVFLLAGFEALIPNIEMHLVALSKAFLIIVI